MRQVTPNTLLGDLLDDYPASFFVVGEHLGLMAVSCPSARYDTLKTCARKNKVSVSRLVRDINRFLKATPGRRSGRKK